jgi:hypothetical protein
MQITIKGEMTIAEIRQAIFEKLHQIEDEFAVTHSMGATLYVNPTDGVGGRVIPRTRQGAPLEKLQCNGPYRCATDKVEP